MPVYQFTTATYKKIFGNPRWTRRVIIDKDGRKREEFTLTNPVSEVPASTPEELEIWFHHLTVSCGRPAAIVKNVLGSHAVSYTLWVAGTRCQIEASTSGKHKLKYAAEGDEFRGEIVQSRNGFESHI